MIVMEKPVFSSTVALVRKLSNYLENKTRFCIFFAVLISFPSFFILLRHGFLTALGSSFLIFVLSFFAAVSAFMPASGQGRD